MEPEDIDALLDEANHLLESGQAEESLRRLDAVEAHELHGEDRIEWASLRAWALSELGRDDEALETLDALLEEFPKSPRLLSTLGVVLSNVDDLEEAREALEEAIELSPTDEVALANLALVYEKFRDYPRALELYDRALALGADIDWVLLRKAAVLTDSGKFEEARSTLKRYLSLVPEDATQWIAVGILYSDEDKYDEAFGCYEQAERLEPDNASLRLNWGVSAVRARRMDMAREQLLHLRRIEPKSSRPWLLEAFILEEEGELMHAAQVYHHVLNRHHFQEEGERTYAYEMAMDFFSRHGKRRQCEALFRRAYADNACTVELCEAYREVTGTYMEKAYWFSLMVEADYRKGLAEVWERGDERPRKFKRFVRDYQIVARDRDDAVGHILAFAQRMGEKNACVREFIGEEPVEDTHGGIYEVEPESLVFSQDSGE